MLKELKQNTLSSDEQHGLSYQMLNLIKEIQRSLTENRKIYSEICRIDSSFSHKLYQPIKHQGIDEMFLKPLVLRQIDQLMEEKQHLVKKKQILIFIRNQEASKKQSELANNTNHYSFLRTTWTKFQTKGDTATQKIDNLNKIIGMVRNNIKSLADGDERSVQKQLQAEIQRKSFLDQIKEEKTRQNIQKLQMRNQQLQMKIMSLNEIIQGKNKKIETLQHQLGHVQNRIKQSIETLYVTGQKLVSLKKTKHNLEAQIKKLQNTENQSPYMLITDSLDNFKIKIQSSTLNEFKIEQTNKTLSEIIQFLKSRSPKQVKQHIFMDQSNPQLLIPTLNLNQTLSTNETTLTDRYLAKSSKFIPMRTQRSSGLNKSQQLKSFGSLNNNTNNGHHEHRQELATLQIPDISIKRFSRKGDLPLTSDRFRVRSNSKVDEENANLLKQ